MEKRPFTNVPKPLRIAGVVGQCLGLFAIGVLAVFAYASSALSNLLIVFVVMGLLAVAMSRLFAVANGNLQFPWKARGWSLYGSAIRIAFYCLAAAVIFFGTVHRALGVDAAPYIVWLPMTGAFALAVISLFPRKFLNLPYLIFCSVMVPALLGVLVFGLREPSKEVYVVGYPIAASGAVVHGGPSLLTNYHYIHQSQKHAYDIGGLLEDGIMRKGDALESDGCFGAPLVAVADGVIAKIEAGNADVEIGERGDGHPAGNHILLEFEPKRYALYAHLKKGSILVNEGQNVKAGEILGACGNSGNTSMPHLHFQIQSELDLFSDANQTFPVRFTGITRMRGGRLASGSDFSLRRNDIIIPE